MGKRSGYRMVDENDPQWVRFWDAYPRRCAKKEARKAWAEIAPSAAMVDQMCETLAWQTVEWARESFAYAPYPASWLRAERWTDEPTVERIMTDEVRRKLGPSSAWACPHVEPCNAPGPCHTMTKLGRPERAGVAS